MQNLLISNLSTKYFAFCIILVIIIELYIVCKVLKKLLRIYWKLQLILRVRIKLVLNKLSLIFVENILFLLQYYILIKIVIIFALLSNFANLTIFLC